jgi:hypothetical protein
MTLPNPLHQGIKPSLKGGLLFHGAECKIFPVNLVLWIGEQRKSGIVHF